MKGYGSCKRRLRRGEASKLQLEVHHSEGPLSDSSTRGVRQGVESYESYESYNGLEP